jgi:hypothetical protein
VLAGRDGKHVALAEHGELAPTEPEPAST